MATHGLAAKQEGHGHTRASRKAGGPWLRTGTRGSSCAASRRKAYRRSPRPTIRALFLTQITHKADTPDRHTIHGLNRHETSGRRVHDTNITGSSPAALRRARRVK